MKSDGGKNSLIRYSIDVYIQIYGMYYVGYYVCRDADMSDAEHWILNIELRKVRV